MRLLGSSRLLASGFRTPLMSQFAARSLAVLAAAPPPVRVAVDLSFTELMNARELDSLAVQLNRAYSANRAAERPLELCITGMAEARRSPECLPSPNQLAVMETGLTSRQHKTLAKEAAAAAAGEEVPEGLAETCEKIRTEHVRPQVRLIDGPAGEAWPVEQLVWLSPDAKAPLKELDPDVVYVIGGIVDRTVVRGTSLKHARQQGAICRRLPMREHAPRADVHPVLSVNACVAVLAAKHSGASWSEAIAAGLPARALKRREMEEDRRNRSKAARRKQVAGRTQARLELMKGAEGADGGSAA